VVVSRGEKRSRRLEPGGTISSVSVADEIMKLATLKEQGHLTPEEFDQQKSILLNNSRPQKSIESMTTGWRPTGWINPAAPRGGPGGF